MASTDHAELTAARRRIAELETELEIHRRATELLKAVVPENTGTRPSRRLPLPISRRGLLPCARRVRVRVATQGITAHWLRHTIITWVERAFGHAVARAFAGHSESGGDGGSTATYAKADLSEVAAAVVALTGEPHPLALAAE